MKTTQEKGKQAEDIAVRFLTQKGYRIVTRNYRFGRGEIDIIALQNKCLVFVEVKFRTSDAFGKPEQTLSKQQEEKIIQTAENYIFENNWEADIRFDIVAILKEFENVHIQHFEDAFY